MHRASGIFRRFRQDSKGGVAIIFAAGIFLLVILAAIVVDMGSVVLRTREVQGAADLAALAAARDLTNADTAALATARANLGSNATVRTEVGIYVADAAKTPDQRFAVRQALPNGARVYVTDEARLFFAGILGKSKIDITRKATAAIPGSEPTALFTLGSRLLSLNDGIVNSLLGPLLGTDISLSIMDYNKLVGADVNLLDFLDELAVELDLDVGDYDALLAHDVTTGEVLKVLEVLVSEDERSVLSQLTDLPVNAMLKVSDIVGVGVDARDGLKRGLDVDVGALDVLATSIQVANGNRHLAADTTLNLGIGKVTVMAAIGDKPAASSWVKLSAINDAVLRTAQTRIYLRVQTASFLAQLAEVDLELLAEIGTAEARISDIQCGKPNKVMVAAKPGVLRVALGEVTNRSDLRDFKKSINVRKKVVGSVLKGLSLVDIRVLADLRSSDTNAQTLTFDDSDISKRTIKTARSKEIVSSLLSSLMKVTSIELSLLDGLINIGLGWLLDLLTPLTSLIGNLLDMILNPLLRLLGVGLGEADVAVYGVNCIGGKGIPNLVG